MNKTMPLVHVRLWKTCWNGDFALSRLSFLFGTVRSMDASYQQPEVSDDAIAQIARLLVEHAEDTISHQEFDSQ